MKKFNLAGIEAANGVGKRTVAIHMFNWIDFPEFISMESTTDVEYRHFSDFQSSPPGTSLPGTRAPRVALCSKPFENLRLINFSRRHTWADSWENPRVKKGKRAVNWFFRSENRSRGRRWILNVLISEGKRPRCSRKRVSRDLRNVKRFIILLRSSVGKFWFTSKVRQSLIPF